MRCIVFRMNLANPALFVVLVSAQLCTLGNAVLAAEPTVPRIRISEDGTHFVVADQSEPFLLRGFNYDHDADGRLLEDYWHDEWPAVVEDFREMKALGANVVRVHLQLPKFMTTATTVDEKNLAKLRELVTLAEQTEIYLDITGLGCYHKADVPSWYDALGEADRWAVQARFWKSVATASNKSPAVFCFDLMNEPILPGKEPAEDWLTGELGGKHFVQRISLSLDGRSREELAGRWINTLTNAIREVDDNTLITIGVIPWAHVWPNAKPVFHNPQVAGPIDFVSVHFYPQKGEVEKAVGALKVYDIGKPVVVEEFFPLKCSYDEAEQFIDETRPIVDGWISFYWGKTPAEYREVSDLKSTLIAGWLERFPGNVLRTHNNIDDLKR